MTMSPTVCFQHSEDLGCVNEAPKPLLWQASQILGVSEEEDGVIPIPTPEETEAQISLPGIRKGAELTF